MKGDYLDIIKSILERHQRYVKGAMRELIIDYGYDKYNPRIIELKLEKQAIGEFMDAYRQERNVS